MPEKFFTNHLSRLIWERNYRYLEQTGPIDQTIEDTWQRIASALASQEQDAQDHWQQQFYQLLSGFQFLPGGRIQAGCGTQHKVTLFNCFVMGTIEDSMDGIFNALKEGALTMQLGGGVGYDFSTLRPAGMPAKVTGRIASGPVSFMHTWDAMCKTILSSGNRRGAMMATLRCDHPDIEAFIEAKKDKTALRNFNLSVLVTDAFMTAVISDSRGNWYFLSPINDRQLMTRRWYTETGQAKPGMYPVPLSNPYQPANSGKKSFAPVTITRNRAYCSSTASTGKIIFITAKKFPRPILAVKSPYHRMVPVIWAPSI